MESVDLISGAEDQARVRAVLDQVSLPEEIEAVSMQLKEDHSGLPAIFLSFQVKDHVQLGEEQIARLSRYMTEVVDRIIRNGISRFPYASLDQAA